MADGIRFTVKCYKRRPKKIIGYLFHCWNEEVSFYMMLSKLADHTLYKLELRKIRQKWMDRNGIKTDKYIYENYC